MTVSSFERKIDAKLIISVVAAGLSAFFGVLAETAMNVAFPALMAEFRVGTSAVQWVTTGYLLVLAIVIPLSALLKARFRTRSIFATAMVFFIAGTLLCGLGPSFWILVAGRIVQGVGTGLTLPLMVNIVLDQAPHRKMGLMMGVSTLVPSLAPAVGPSFGGMVVTHLGWRWIFFLSLPFLVAALGMGWYAIRQATPLGRVTFPLLDVVVLAVGFGGIVAGTSLAGEAGWASPLTLGFLLVGVLAVAGFCVRSSRRENPLLRVTVFRTPVFSLNVLSIFLLQLICLGLGFLLPNLAQISYHMSAFAAGCLLLPGTLVAAFLGPLAGRFLDKHGPLIPLLGGGASALLSALLFAVGQSLFAAWSFILFYLFFAIGQGMAYGTTMTTGLRALPAELSADGNAVISTLQQLAGGVGTAIVSTVVASQQGGLTVSSVAGSAQLTEQLEQATLHGSHLAFVVLACCAVVMMASAVCSVRLQHQRR